MKAAVGIRIRSVPAASGLPLVGGMLAAGLFAAGMLALCSMLQADVEPLWLCVGCLLSAGLTVLPGRLQRWGFSLAAACLVLLVLLQSSAVLAGARLAAVRLFAASEAVNRYQYIALNVPTDAASVRQAWQCFELAGVLLGACACALCLRYKLTMAALAAAMVGMQVYFGVTPAWGLDAAWFALCGAVLVYDGHTVRDVAVLLCVALCVASMTGMLVPGVHQPLEERSEQLRDRLDAWLQNAASVQGSASDTANETRLENRLNEESAAQPEDASAMVQEYEKVIRVQEEISAPHVLALRRMLLWFGVLVVLLAGPFVPFYLWDRRRRQMQAQRALFAAEDASQAVQAMFLQADRCLRAAVLMDDNTPMHQLPQSLAGRVPEPLHQQLVAALPVWHKAAYSDHPIDEQERAAVAQLLHSAEQHLLQTSDARKRLRLQWQGLLPGEVDE